MYRTIRLMLLSGFLAWALILAPQVLGANAGPWVFFDLGKTLIDYEPDFSRIRFLPGSLDYLKDLKRRGFHLGLLVNWPENEGKGNAEKLRLLKEFVAPRWIDSVPPDWSLFEAVLFPQKDIYRKPHPYLFIEALRIAAPHAVVYQGEDRYEVEVARNLGLVVNDVTHDKGEPAQLIPLESIKAKIRADFIYQTPP